MLFEDAFMINWKNYIIITIFFDQEKNKISSKLIEKILYKEMDSGNQEKVYDADDDE